MWPFHRTKPDAPPVRQDPPPGDELPAFGPESIDQMLALIPDLETPADQSRFIMTLILSGFALGFDWIKWRDGEGRKLIKDPSLLDKADVIEIRKLFTYLWRQDHFFDGVLHAAFVAGVPQQALRRLAAIREAR